MSVCATATSQPAANNAANGASVKIKGSVGDGWAMEIRQHECSQRKIRNVFVLPALSAEIKLRIANMSAGIRHSGVFNGHGQDRPHYSQCIGARWAHQLATLATKVHWSPNATAERVQTPTIGAIRAIRAESIRPHWANHLEVQIDVKLEIRHGGEHVRRACWPGSRWVKRHIDDRLFRLRGYASNCAGSCDELVRVTEALRVRKAAFARRWPDDLAGGGVGWEPCN